MSGNFLVANFTEDTFLHVYASSQPMKFIFMMGRDESPKSENLKGMLN